MSGFVFKKVIICVLMMEDTLTLLDFIPYLIKNISPLNFVMNKKTCFHPALKLHKRA